MAQFSFSVKVCSQYKTFTFDVPTNSQGVITNRFCPKDFLVPQNSFYDAMEAVNGETLLEFKHDCESMAHNISTSSLNNSNIRIQVYLDAFDRLLVEHVNRCGRLIFNDFLIYLDILCYFLYADNVSEYEIKLNYPRFAFKYLNTFKDRLKDSWTLLPLAQTNMAETIKRLNRESEMKLGGIIK